MRFQCSYCKAVLDIDDGEPGELVACGQCNATVAVPMSVTSPGAMLGDFAIVREIGVGGMGRVYLAHQVSLDRPVALKILSENFARDANFIQNFINEARTAAALNHPNIVQAYAVNYDSGCYYFAMELVEGNTMKQVLQNSGRLVHEKVVSIAKDILGALAYAWQEKKLIHRDIKPDNIMLTNDGRTKLADLGLARKITETNADGSSELYGTPQYVAPELILSFPPDIRSDIYSMGATLYHALTGAYPYQAQDANSMALEHLYRPLRPVSEQVSDVPPALARMVEIMLAKRPGHRYQNYQSLLDDLQLVQRGEMPKTELPALAQTPINTDLPGPQSLSIEAADLQAAAAASAGQESGPVQAVPGAGTAGLKFGKKNSKLVLGGKPLPVSGLAAAPGSTGPVLKTAPGELQHEVPAGPTPPDELKKIPGAARKKTVLLLAAGVTVLLCAGLAWWFFQRKKPESQQTPAAPQQTAGPAGSSGLAAVQTALQKLTSESEKLAFLKRESGKFDLSSPEYEGFVTLAAPLLEPALQASRERGKAERKADWENQQTRYQEEFRQQQEAARIQAERDAREKAEKAEQERLAKEAEQKKAAFAGKQQEMRDLMVQQAQKLDFSGARKIFAVMAESQEEEEREWAGMWLACIDDAEQLYQLLRNSKDKLAGVVFKFQDGNRQRDWQVVSILYDTVKLVRVPTEKESSSKNPEPQPEKTFELDTPNPTYVMILAQKALELAGRADEYDRMCGHFLLVRGYFIARKNLEAAMVSERLLNEIQGIRISYVRACVQAMKKMNLREAELEANRLKKNFSAEFEMVAEEVQQLLGEKK